MTPTAAPEQDAWPVYRRLSLEDKKEMDVARMPAFAVVWVKGQQIVLVAGGGGTKGTGVPSGIVVNEVLKNQDLNPIGFLNTFDQLVTTVAAHPDGSHFVCGVNQFSYILTWNSSSNSLSAIDRFQAEFSDDHPFQSCIQFNNSGSLIVTGGDDHIVRTFSFSSLVRQHDFKNHDHCIGTVSFSPSSELIASTAHEGNVNVWKSDRSGFSRLAYENREIRGAIFNPLDDSILFAWMNNKSGNSFLVKWDQTTGEIVAHIPIDARPSTGGSISSDGSLIAVSTVKDNATVYIFSTYDLTVVGKHSAIHDFPQTSMHFSPTSRHIISVSADMSYAIMSSRTSIGLKRKVFIVSLLVLLLSIAQMYFPVSYLGMAKNVMTKFGPASENFLLPFSSSALDYETPGSLAAFDYESSVIESEGSAQNIDASTSFDNVLSSGPEVPVATNNVNAVQTSADQETSATQVSSVDPDHRDKFVESNSHPSQTQQIRHKIAADGFRDVRPASDNVHLASGISTPVHVAPESSLDIKASDGEQVGTSDTVRVSNLLEGDSYQSQNQGEDIYGSQDANAISFNDQTITTRPDVLGSQTSDSVNTDDMSAVDEMPSESQVGFPDADFGNLAIGGDSSRLQHQQGSQGGDIDGLQDLSTVSEKKIGPDFLGSPNPDPGNINPASVYKETSSGARSDSDRRNYQDDSQERDSDDFQDANTIPNNAETSTTGPVVLVASKPDIGSIDHASVNQETSPGSSLASPVAFQRGQHRSQDGDANGSHDASTVSDIAETSTAGPDDRGVPKSDIGSVDDVSASQEASPSAQLAPAEDDQGNAVLELNDQNDSQDRDTVDSYDANPISDNAETSTPGSGVIGTPKPDLGNTDGSHVPPPGLEGIDAPRPDLGNIDQASTGQEMSSSGQWNPVDADYESSAQFEPSTNDVTSDDLPSSNPPAIHPISDSTPAGGKPATMSRFANLRTKSK